MSTSRSSPPPKTGSNPPNQKIDRRKQFAAMKYSRRASGGHTQRSDRSLDAMQVDGIFPFKRRDSLSMYTCNGRRFEDIEIGSARSLMSFSDTSDVNSIFSNLSRKIGNESIRSMTMSEISGIEEVCNEDFEDSFDLGPIDQTTLASAIEPEILESIDIKEPSDVDVLCGRKFAALRHPGNQTYRHLVSQNKELYITCLVTEKIKVSRSIVAAIREQGGRFLTKDENKGTWFDIGDKKAIEKTSQALREGQPKLRQKMMVELGGQHQFGNGMYTPNQMTNPGLVAAAPCSGALQMQQMASMQRQALTHMNLTLQDMMVALDLNPNSNRKIGNMAPRSIPMSEISGVEECFQGEPDELLQFKNIQGAKTA